MAPERFSALPDHRRTPIRVKPIVDRLNMELGFSGDLLGAKPLPAETMDRVASCGHNTCALLDAKEFLQRDRPALADLRNDWVHGAAVF